MKDLERYKIINSCETFKELQKAIVEISDVNNYIYGKTKLFDANKMASFCSRSLFIAMPNALTRNYGIRQQAFYLLNSK